MVFWSGRPQRTGGVSLPAAGARAVPASPSPKRPAKAIFSRLARIRPLPGPLAALRARIDPAGGPGQVYFVVSAKELPRAVDRNRLKRQGRAWARSIVTTLPQGWIGAFYMKRAAREASFATLCLELTRLVTGAGTR